MTTLPTPDYIAYQVLCSVLGRAVFGLSTGEHLCMGRQEMVPVRCQYSRFAGGRGHPSIGRGHLMIFHQERRTPQPYHALMSD